MDLKVWRKLYFLNIVDLVTKFYRIVEIDEKQVRIIIKDFIFCFGIKFLYKIPLVLLKSCCQTVVVNLITLRCASFG